MKETYVVFTESGARIYTNPDADVISKFPSGAIVLRNPKRINIAGVPPHLWAPHVSSNEIHPIGEAPARRPSLSFTRKVAKIPAEPPKEITSVEIQAVNIGFFRKIKNWFTK